VATQAGITAGALYYYFDSKLDMYLAVFRHLQATIDGRIMAATESQSTFDAKLRAILEVAHQLNAENPTIARFQGTARIDRVRHPELASAIPNPPGEGAGFMQELLDAGERTGEIRPERRDQVAALVRTIMVGLVVSSTQDPADQRTAIDGMFALLDRTLVQPPRHAARP
jgi:AcrR family transcriptional regulator